MDSRKLEHLAELATTGSFSRAAENLHLTQPALSKSIQALEEELGAVLIDRRRKPFALTAKGEMVVQRARRLLKDMDELHRVAAEDIGPEGLLRIGFGAGPWATLSRGFIQHVVEHFPRLHLQVRHGSGDALVGALHERQMDLAIVDARSFPSSPHLQAETLGHLHGSAVCRVGHPLQRLERVTLKDLLAYPTLNTSISDEAVRWVQESHGVDLDLRQHTTVECEQLETLLDVCARSDAVFLGVREAAHPWVLRGEMAVLAVHPLITEFSVPIALVSLAGRSPSQLTTWVRDFVAGALDERHFAEGRPF